MIWMEMECRVYLEIGGCGPRAVTSCADNSTLVNVTSGHQANNVRPHQQICTRRKWIAGVVNDGGGGCSRGSGGEDYLVSTYAVGEELISC